MSKPPNNWPPAAMPCRLDAGCAAYYVGVSKTKFLQGVLERRYPQPVRDGTRKLWVTSELKANAEGTPVDGVGGMAPDETNPWDRSLAKKHAGQNA